MFQFLLLALASIQVALGACTGGQGNCAQDGCATIGGEQYCVKCATTHVPVDGACVAADPAPTGCTPKSGSADGTCASCSNGYFLYQGGCFKAGAADAADAVPGRSLCSAAASGYCTEAATGYFVIPAGTTGLSNAVQSVIACNDTTGVTINTDQTYRGAKGCGKCAIQNQNQKPPAGGSRVAATFTAACSECAAGFYTTDADAPVTCTACNDETSGIPNCDTCAYASSTLSCTACSNDQFVALDKKSCVASNGCGTGAVADSTATKVCKCAASGTTVLALDKKSCIAEAACTGIAGAAAGTVDGASACVCSKTDFQLNAAGTACECAKGYYLSGTGNSATCAACGTGTGAVAHCGECTNDGSYKCTACADGYYSTNAANAAVTACTPCGTDTKSGETVTVKGISDCTVCSFSTAGASGSVIGTLSCTACGSDKFLVPSGAACVTSEACQKAGLYGNEETGKCAACDSTCATCVGAANNQCASCPAGKVLTYAGTDVSKGGSCGPECAEETDTTKGCNACGATIGGAKYCSKCNVGTQFPINGVCATNTQRATTCETGQIENGVCKKCSAGFFLQDGGCYQVDRLPGSLVCETAGTAANSNAGTCAKCAATGAAGATGCPACPTTCATCTFDTAAKCTSCPAGRYLDAAGACKLCIETSGDVTGVGGCVRCVAPSGGAGSVLCYETGTPAEEPASNDSKGGLSAGAIAGIVVAVVVVVGGLVGFLCWWFICRK